MFDPFQDFHTAGYLRNVDALKDPDEVAVAQHGFFLANLGKAATYLARRNSITYAHYCEVHRLLFGEFYPWAGKDRLTLNVGTYISKGGRVQFEQASMAQAAIESGLRLGNNQARIADRPGHVMGLFAWGHPFLDGNGRTMAVVHAELLHRAGFAIDWAKTHKDQYLEALTGEIDDPRAGILDAYLRPFMRVSNPKRDWVRQLLILPGLDGRGSEPSDIVAYSANDARGRAEYEAIAQARAGAVP